MARRSDQPKKEKPVPPETVIAEWEAGKGRISIEHLAWKYELSLDKARKLIEDQTTQR